MKYDTILLDADGTLLDFAKSEKEAVSDTMRACGVVPTEELTRRYSEINASLWKQLERKELRREELLIRRFALLVEECHLSADPLCMAKLYPSYLSQNGYVLEGAVSLLERLRPHARLYLATNGIKKIQSSRLEKSGLLSLVDGVFVSEDMGVEKPDIRFFEGIAKALPSMTPQRTVIVGDSLSSDMRGGLAYGIDTCWYNPSGAPIPPDMPLTYVATNFDEIYQFILS
ncbi:MAG: YjjG family noncanonical pyrimidine nucleotidase [Clostridia bacterium]|nr:YjjG family noncanonical pyrimidine nucleotidase [Clostridia bacterium]